MVILTWSLFYRWLDLRQVPKEGLVRRSSSSCSNFSIPCHPGLRECKCSDRFKKMVVRRISGPTRTILFGCPKDYLTLLSGISRKRLHPVDMSWKEPTCLLLFDVCPRPFFPLTPENEHRNAVRRLSSAQLGAALFALRSARLQDLSIEGWRDFTDAGIGHTFGPDVLVADWWGPVGTGEAPLN